MGVNMTYQELIDELRDLGFEEDSTMTEYNEITAHAINRAANLAFDTIVVPLTGYYKTVYKETTRYYKEEEVYSVYEDVEGESVFVRKEKRKAKYSILTIGDGEPQKDTSYESVEVVDRTTPTYSKKEMIDEIVVEWYPRRPEVLTSESDPETEIGIPDNLLKPMALLTAHYLWLDDDMEKAIIYYNEWETFANNILNACQNNAKAKIITFGWGW